MTQVTLEHVQAKQAELATLIEQLTKQTPSPVTTIFYPEVAIELQPGEHYAGPVLTVNGTLIHHLVLLAARPDIDLNWTAAKAWAEKEGGTLPDRQEQALLFANTTAIEAKPRRKQFRPLLVTHRGERVPPYVPIVEKALGHRLPAGAEVHHVDQNPFNNDPGNLVICPSPAYHKLLHQRQRAFDASGHYHWRKCQFCQRYDDPTNLWTDRKKAFHRSCSAAAKRVYLAKIRRTA